MHMRSVAAAAALSLLVLTACGDDSSGQANDPSRPRGVAASDAPRPIDGISAPDFDGGRAFSHIETQVAFGPRVAGTTGHAEAVRVTYDPKVVRYDQLLRVLFSVVADPTLKNRQGPDSGTQYRAAIFPLNAEQRQVATSYLAQMRSSGVWERPIVVEIESGRFYPAETYHQDFADKNPTHPYIRRWDAPKVVALRTMYPTLYRAEFKTG